MKERPIIFSDESVRAILDGRKTQTRRVAKLYPSMTGKKFVVFPPEEIVRFDDGTFNYLSTGALSGPYACSYGKPGDRLWVRETWQFIGWPSIDDNDWVIQYKNGECKAVDAEKFQDHDMTYWEQCSDDLNKAGWPTDDDGLFYPPDPSMDWYENCPTRWRSSMFMPRWASRLALEIVDVRAEPLQDISEADAIAEGPPDIKNIWSHRIMFERLWDRFNAKRGFPWESNPWVWVIEFRKVEK